MNEVNNKTKQGSNAPMFQHKLLFLIHTVDNRCYLVSADTIYYDNLLKPMLIFGNCSCVEQVYNEGTMRFEQRNPESPGVMTWAFDKIRLMHQIS